MICATKFFTIYFMATVGSTTTWKVGDVTHSIGIGVETYNRAYTESDSKYSVTYQVICEDQKEFYDNRKRDDEYVQ